MTTPTVNLGISHIQTEFGGSNPAGMAEYYGVNANVAVSGTITMASFLGISATSPAQVLARSPYDFGIYSANAQSRHISANGNWTGSGSTLYAWLNSGAAADYEIKATRTGGTDSASFSASWSNNTWIGMGSDRRFYLPRGSIGYYTANYDVSIRYASNSTVIMTAAHNLVTEVQK